MNSLSGIKKELMKWDDFIILGHVNPDGDCIGSLFAMKWYLELKGKNTMVLLEEDPVDIYGFLKIDSTDYRLFDDKRSSLQDYLPDTEGEIVCIALDAGDPKRINPGQDMACNSYLINIDHHVDNPAYGNFNYINSNMSAVGEIIYNLIEVDGNIKFSKKIGRALATAIISDTGGLRYQNTTTRVYRIIANLAELGVDIYQINRALFGSFSFEYIKLKGLVLSTLTLAANGQIAFLKIKQTMLDESGIDLSSVSGLVNYARDIKGVEVGIAFTEINANETRISFRSNHYCPVNKIAAEFDGGGHPRAAGCTIKKSLEKSSKLVIDKVKEYV